MAIIVVFLSQDLVKVHLMLAVREEIDELQVELRQLMERNYELQMENSILRQSAATKHHHHQVVSTLRPVVTNSFVPVIQHAVQRDPS